MKRIAIISPSGNFYGSEQVLFDFLNSTAHVYDVYLPYGKLHEHLVGHGRHRLHLFSSVKVLYLKLAFVLATGRYDGIYINEGGHIRYLNLLSRLFPDKQFIAHIRLLEDCAAERICARKNIKLISVSQYITDEMKQNTGLDCQTIYDLYQPVSCCAEIKRPSASSHIRLGVVGRVTPTKGLSAVREFCDFCETHCNNQHLEFHFFGGVEDDLPEVSSFVAHAKEYKNISCVFEGFVNGKQNIYNKIDILLHFNQLESLGRIVFESLDFGVPFVAFGAGGTGELAAVLGLGDLMVSPTEGWKTVMLSRISDLIANDSSIFNRYSAAKTMVHKNFKPEVYTTQIESVFHE